MILPLYNFRIDEGIVTCEEDAVTSVKSTDDFIVFCVLPTQFNRNTMCTMPCFIHFYLSGGKEKTKATHPPNFPTTKICSSSPIPLFLRIRTYLCAITRKLF